MMKFYNKKVMKGILIFVIILMAYNLVSLFQAYTEINKLIKIGEQLGLNESNGDFLIDCGNGNYEIYNNKSNQLFFCNNKIQIKNNKILKQSKLGNIYD